MQGKSGTQGYQKIIDPVEVGQLESELQTLAGRLIIERSHYELYLAPSNEMPWLMQEIGRLREQTFRLAGEGTGTECDIDPYDGHYFNLFIWDREERQIVGGYRLGLGPSIMATHGVTGFYISSLFEIDEGALPILRKSVELGRSFVVPEYQKKHFPLLLLWQGILHFLTLHPQCEYLIGPVSISKFYSELSKSVIVSFIKRYCYDEDIARFFKPRTAFHPNPGDINIDAAPRSKGHPIADLDSFLSTIEPEHLKVPVLLKQYARQNAKFIGFNLDPNFSGALDGLMLLHLSNLPEATLQMLNR